VGKRLIGTGGACAPRPPDPAVLEVMRMLNPLRSEREAFRLLLYVIAVAVVVIVVALIVQALK
jgi:hypothetical protein